MDPLLEVDPAEVRQVLTTFLQDYVQEAGAGGVVVGLSGGLDSALVCALAADALGPDRVLALLLPEARSRPEDAKLGEAVGEALDVETRRVEVTGIVEAVEEAVPDLPKSARINVPPRVRMTVLYAHANRDGRLVAATGNKSELLTGYFTKHGDGAGDVHPIGDLYKTQVRAVAAAYPIPQEVVERPPSAGLYEGQTDEDELGLPYGDLDRVLVRLESGHGAARIAEATGLDREVVEDVVSRVHRAEHKRTPLVIPKLGFRTPGLDWRAPRTGGGGPS